MIFRRKRKDVAPSPSPRRLDAESMAAAAEARHRATEQLAAQSRTITARLVREVEKNGWTELLQTAWGAR